MENQNIDINKTIAQIKQDMDSKKVWIESRPGYRVYTDGQKEVVITNPKETAINYYNTFIVSNIVNSPLPGTTSSFDNLPRCSIFVGKPDTGKTYQAQQLAEDLGVPYLLIMARDNLNLETLLEDFTLVDGKPVFQESLAIKMLSGTENGIIIIDEFNTLLTGVMKTLQPLLDTTSKTFEYKGKVYNKNLNCKFILTLNDKDKGISIIPDAILSRSYIKYFTQPDNSVLSQWSGKPLKFVEDLASLYQALDLSSIFGTRQINIVYNLQTVDEIIAHFNGLCSLRGMDATKLDTIETKRLFTALCSKR